MFAWGRESDAERPWATWGLLAVPFLVQIGAGLWPELRERLALVPGAPHVAALLGHHLLHAGWLSLFASAFFVAATGPWLEQHLGRRLLLASYLAAALVGAALFALSAGEDDPPWLGASAAVAAWLGLLTVGGRGAPVDLLGVAAGRAGRLLAPAWAPAALWFGGELAGLLTSESSALGVHAVCFGLGAALALGLERSGMVEWPAGAVAGAKRPLSREVRAALEAPEQLEALLADAKDPAIARAYLEHADAEGRRDSARAVLAERLREALEARRREPAVALWCASFETGLAPESSVEKLLQLASWSRAAGHGAAGTAALHAALACADPAAAAKIARSARRSDPVVCLRAAERALEDAALGAAERSALEGLRTEAQREVAARGVIVVPGAAPARPQSGPPPARGGRVTAPGPTRALGLGEAIELAPEPPLVLPKALPDPERSGEAAFIDAFHAALHEDAEPEAKADEPPLRRLLVREALPTALESDTLVLDVPARGAFRLRLTRIHAIALAGVRGLSDRAGDKPVLLVDLCLSAEGEAELQVLRLRSDRFDPRPLAPSPETSPLKALRAFVTALAAAARAPLLPADDVAGEGTLRIFRDLASYQVEVLRAS